MPNATSGRFDVTAVQGISDCPKRYGTFCAQDLENRGEHLRKLIGRRNRYGTALRSGQHQVTRIAESGTSRFLGG